MSYTLIQMYIDMFIIIILYNTRIYAVVHVLKVVHEALQEPVAFEVVGADEVGKDFALRIFAMLLRFL